MRCSPYVALLLGSVASACADDRPRPPAGEGSQGVPPLSVAGTSTPESVSKVPAISGGTLLVTRDGDHAYVSDPDRDRVVVASFGTGTTRTIQLEPGDEPGRLVEDDDGAVHVVLRGSSALLTISSSRTRRVGVCRAPRGVAYDAGSGQLHVACATGELWSLDAGAGAVERVIDVAPDLRDVVVRGERLFVTTFRRPELLVLDADGAVAARHALGSEIGASPTVAWRMIELPSGVAIVHQQSSNREIDLAPSTDLSEPSFGGTYTATSCAEVLLHSMVTTFEEGAGGELVRKTAVLGPFALPVDVASSPDASELAVVSAGAGGVTRVPPILGPPNCNLPLPAEPAPGLHPVAAAYAGEDLVVVTRDPVAVHRYLSGGGRQTIDLGGDDVDDAALVAFHDGANGISCASCHPEGREDGHVWRFLDLGPRRTQTLLGGAASRFPLHWDGDLPTFRDLVKEVMVRRMAHDGLSGQAADAMQAWLGALPELRASHEVDPEIARPGRAAFERAGCADCHGGPALTSEGSHDVGTGGTFQVPSLRGLALRTPLMHDGCAATIEERFDESCGGTDHGDVSGLDDAEYDALLRYLHAL